MLDWARAIDGGWRSCLRARSVCGGVALALACLVAAPDVRAGHELPLWKAEDLSKGAGGLALAGELHSDHFILLTYGRVLYAREVLRRAEAYYQSIARRLGYDRYENFWTWEDRCRIVLYPDKAAYVGASEGTEWTEGYANFRTREIISYENETRLLEKVLPHEIAHLILHDFVGPHADLPLWFDEGVALSQEQAAQPVFHVVAVRAIQEGRYVPIRRLGSELVSHPSVAYRTVEQFYAEASYLVDFWIDHFPKGKFVEFLRGLRVGLGFEEAFARAFSPYGVASLEELESRMVAETLRRGRREEALSAREKPRLAAGSDPHMEGARTQSSQVIIKEQVTVK